VLVPLHPSEVRLVEQAAGLLSRILDVPVRLARLPDEWHWGIAQREYRQRDVQAFIERKVGKSVDFANWTLQRYRDELLKAVAKGDPLTRFQVASFSQELGTKPGQYLAGAPVLELFQTIQALRSNDRRTMYVGVTEADIYTGETNYVFTSGWRQGELAAAISSYARMKSAASSEQYESRKRLIERIAKELVPATLQQLGIPRPIDPADPYSYSDGVDRVSQKTLTLSAPTRAALDRFRGGP
jgi:predicted Zn-dependent protease